MKRIPYVDIAKGVCIIYIVFGHLLRSGILFSYISSVSLVMFFFLSGMTYRFSENRAAFYRKKLHTIVIPYLFAGLVSICLYALLGSFAGKRLGVAPKSTALLPNLLGLLYANSKTGYMKWNTPLWFLPCLFCVVALADGFETLLRRYLPSVPASRICCMLLSMAAGLLLNGFFPRLCLPWQLETAFHMLPFYEAGILFRTRAVPAAGPDAPPEAPPVLSSGIPALLSVLLLLLGATFLVQNGEVSVRTDEYHSYPLFLATGILSIAGYLSLCIRIAHCRVLEYIGQNTLAILLWHKFPVLLFQTVLPFFAAALRRTDTPQAVFAAVLPCAVTILLCLLWGIILRRFLPWTLGVPPRESS